MKTVDPIKHLAVLLVEVTDKINTKADSSQPIFGTSLDENNPPLAWCVKKRNLLLKASNLDVEAIINGTATILPVVFEKASNFKTHSLQFIRGKEEEMRISKFNSVISKYENKNSFEIVQIYNSANRGGPAEMLYPEFTWTELPAPPMLQRVNGGALPVPAFACARVPTWDLSDGDTWLLLNRAEFLRCVNTNGWYPEHVAIKGEPFEQATIIAAKSVAYITAITSTSTAAEITAMSNKISVFTAADSANRYDEANHAKNLLTQESRFRKCKQLFNTALGPSIQPDISSYIAKNDFHGAYAALDEKYGVVANGTIILNLLKGALLHPQTYANRTTVQDLCNAWEAVMVILTDLSYNTLQTALVDQIPYGEICSSLYLSDADFLTKYPTGTRIISYADSRTYFLFAHKNGEFSHKIVNFATEKKKVTIADIKQSLLDAEQYLRAHPNPLTSKPSAYQASISQDASTRGDYTSHEIEQLVAQARTGEYHTEFIHSSEDQTENEYSAFYASSTALRIKDPEYLKPCAICKHARDRAFREKAQDHVALQCPALSNLATLSDLQINSLGFPTNIQALLPKYTTLLSKRISFPKTEPNNTSLKRPHENDASSEIEQLKKRITELQRGGSGAPTNPYARQVFVPSNNESKELEETKA